MKLWTLGKWGSEIRNGEIVRVPWEKRDHSLVELRTVTSTTSERSAPDFPCDVCGCPARFTVYDYQEIKPGQTVNALEKRILCDIHRRPSRVYLLDGSMHSLHEMRLEFPEGEPPVVKWEGDE